MERGRAGATGGTGSSTGSAAQPGGNKGPTGVQECQPACSLPPSLSPVTLPLPYLPEDDFESLVLVRPQLGQVSH